MKKALALSIMLTVAAVGGSSLQNAANAKDGKCTKSECTKSECTTPKESNCPLIQQAALKRNLSSYTLVDALDQKYFDRSRVKGSINLPMGTEEAKVAELLPNKKAKIVVYCMNTKCHASDAVATQLTKLGYKHVEIYREGLQDLIANGFAVEGTNPNDPIPPKTASN